MSYLCSPLTGGKLMLANRLVMPPMATAKADLDGTVNQALLDYYAEKSRGGYLGLIIIEHCFVALQGKAGEGQLSAADDAGVEMLGQLARTIHHNGTKAVLQINHAGSGTDQSVTGCEVVAPSAIMNLRKGNTIPRELTKKEIQTIIGQFAAAARRAKEAGFDGVEIHSAHGYLLNQFFSPLANKRTDEYGGDVLGRIKIHLEIIRAVRDAVGDAFPILLRLGAADYMEGGSTIEDSKVAARAFEQAGVDVLDISGGFCGYMIPGNRDQGYFSPLTAAIKEVVSVPVILTGGITEAAAAEQLLATDKADLVGVGRAVLAESFWAKNAVDRLK